MKSSRILLGAAIVAMTASVVAVMLPRSLEDAPDETPATITTSQLGSPIGVGQNVDAVIDQLQTAIADDSKDWNSWAKLGLAYLAKSRSAADPTYYNKAEEALARSLEINGEDNFEAIFGMSSLQASRHRFGDALTWAKRGAALRPDNPDVLGIKGDALVELGRYREAADTFQAMVDLRPGLPSYARMSYLSELHGNISDARVAMRSAYRAAGSPDDAAWARSHLGDLYFNAGELGRALGHYRSAAELSPSNPLGRAGVAKVAAARGALPVAIRLMEEVVEGSGEPGYPALLSEYSLAAGRRQEASRAFDKFLRREELERANGTNTNLESALIEADRQVALRDALERARREYSERHSVHVADALGWVLYAHGRYAEAWRHSKESFRIGTNNALFHFHAGMIAEKLERPEVARRHLRTALRINPYFSIRHSETARRTLDRLEGR
jgi:tetratricopeptide (TPR) repeat protein